MARRKSNGGAAVAEPKERVHPADEIENEPDYEAMAAAAEKAARKEPVRPSVDRRAAVIARMQGPPPEPPAAALPPASAQPTLNAAPDPDENLPLPGRPVTPVASAAPAATPPVPPAPSISERMLNLAEAWGISREDAGQYPNESALTHAINVLSKRFGVTPQAVSAPSAPPPATPVYQPQAAPPAQAASAPILPATPVAQHSFGQKYELAIPASFLDPEQTSPETVAFAKAMKDAYERQEARLSALADENARLKGSFDQIVGSAQQYAGSAKIQQFDAYIESLGTDFAEVFGDGSSEDFPEHTPQFKARDELFRDFQELEQVYRARGERPPSAKKLLARAFKGRYADTLNQKTVSELSERARTASSQFIARPAMRNGNGVPSNPDTVGKANLAARMREAGIGPYGNGGAEAFE